MLRLCQRFGLGVLKTFRIRPTFAAGAPVKRAIKQFCIRQSTWDQSTVGFHVVDGIQVEEAEGDLHCIWVIRKNL